MESVENVIEKVYGFFTDITPKIKVSEILISRPIYQHAIPFGATFLYLLMLVVFPKIQSRYKFLHSFPRLMKTIFFCWNVFLSLYSLTTCAFFTSSFLHMVFIRFKERKNPLFHIVCLNDCHVIQDFDPNVFWGYLFCISKFFELLDTFFLILKKPERPLKFLHWYHHITVKFLCWYSVMYSFSPGFITAFINSIIHSFMYYYYAVAEVSTRPKWGFILTLGQITQMVLGCTIVITWIYGYLNGDNCCIKGMGVYIVVPMMGVIYASYLALFLDFMYKRYFKKKVKKDEKRKKKK